MGPFARNGLSLACNGCPFQSHHSRVNGTGLLLRSLTTSCAARSALLLCHRYRLAPVPAASSLSGPLQLGLPLPPAATPASTPLRGSYPPSDQSVQPVSLPVGPPSESARFPLAPRCRSFFNYGRGSSFLSRYVSGGLLFLKPLGTSFTMLPKLFGVNDYCDRYTHFPHNLFALFQISYGVVAVTILWIKHRFGGLFYFSFRIMPLSVAIHRLLSSVAEKVTWRATAR